MCWYLMWGWRQYKGKEFYCLSNISKINHYLMLINILLWIYLRTGLLKIFFGPMEDQEMHILNLEMYLMLCTWRTSLRFHFLHLLEWTIMAGSCFFWCIAGKWKGRNFPMVIWALFKVHVQQIPVHNNNPSR